MHQLLGLRLRFCLRGKYSDIFNLVFQINFVDLFWPVPAAATECKRANVSRNIMTYDKIGIAIIQSLLDNERQTGKELFDTTIKYIQYSKPFLESDFFDVSNKEDFFDVLQKIIQVAKTENKFYFLHFEAHGNDEGISMKNGEQITWPELLPKIQELNIFYKNNLSVHLAVCNGNSFLRAINPIERSPFAFIIGSFETIYNNDILTAFEVFYTNFFSDFNIVNAFEKMRKISEKSDFSIISAWHIIDLVIELQNNSNDKQKMLDLIDESFINGEQREIIKSLGNKFKAEVIKIHEEFTIKRDYYLMEDF